MSDYYKIGVAIMLRDGMSPVLSHISERLLGVHKSVKDIEGGFNRWKLAIGGAAAAVAGSGLLVMMAKVASHAKEFQHELAKARALGLDPGQMKQVADKAWENTRAVSGTSVAGNVKTIGSLYSIVGLDEALKLSTKFEKADQVLQAVGKGEHGSAYVLARAGELMGKFTDPKTGKLDVGLFSHFLDTITRSVIATHGMVGAKEWLQYAKQAGPAAGNLDENGMLTTTAVIQAMGGFRAGTAAQALSRQFAGGVMQQRIAKELTRLNIAKEGDFQVVRGGQIIAKTDAMKGFVAALQHDPLDAIVSYLIPTLEKHGFNTNEKLSREIYRFVGTGPAQREVYELIRGRYQIAAERERAKGGMGVSSGYENFNKTDPERVMKGVTEAWSNMLTALGNSALVAAVPTMLRLTDLFNNISTFANSHADAIWNITKGIAALGVALVGGGAVAIFAAMGPAGWLVGAIAALGAAVAMMPQKEIDELANDFRAIGAAAAACVAPIKWLADAIGALAKFLPGGGVTPKGAMPNFVPGAEGAPGFVPHTSSGRQGYNAVPPSGADRKLALHINSYLNTRKVAEAVTEVQARDANGPLNGSAYYDGSATHVPADYAYARG